MQSSAQVVEVHFIHIRHSSSSMTDMNGPGQISMNGASVPAYNYDSYEYAIANTSARRLGPRLLRFPGPALYSDGHSGRALS